MSSKHQQWEKVIFENGLSLDDSQLYRLRLYHDLLVEWNAKVNLISRKDEANVWPNHILHSISPLFTMRIQEGAKLADIGSGGGLPGIPIAILQPKVEIVLIESIKKKCVVMNDMILRLGLTNAIVVNERVEELTKSKDHQKRFDIIVARAVAPLEELIKWAAPLAHKETVLEITIRHKQKLLDEIVHLPVLVALKGGDLTEEVTKAKRLAMCKGIRLDDIHFSGIKETGLVDKKIVTIAL